MCSCAFVLELGGPSTRSIRSHDDRISFFPFHSFPIETVCTFNLFNGITWYYLIRSIAYTLIYSKTSRSRSQIDFSSSAWNENKRPNIINEMNNNSHECHTNAPRYYVFIVVPHSGLIFCFLPLSFSLLKICCLIRWLLLQEQTTAKKAHNQRLKMYACMQLKIAARCACMRACDRLCVKFRFSALLLLVFRFVLNPANDPFPAWIRIASCIIIIWISNKLANARANVGSILFFVCFDEFQTRHVLTIWCDCVRSHAYIVHASAHFLFKCHLYFSVPLFFCSIRKTFEAILYWSAATTNKPMCQVKINETKQRRQRKNRKSHYSIEFNFLRFWIQCKLLCMWITVCDCM